MSHTSPASFLVWAILSTLLGAFLVFHLWSFDRFKCLKWNNGPYSGAFKRIMTYSYLISIPTIIAFSYGMTAVKYIEGFIIIPGHGFIPVPYELWPDKYQRLIFPFYLMFSISWSLEMITHLEELCFWLFLVNAGSAQQDWFASWYFKTWIAGSCVAVVYLPLISIFTRGNPLRSEAYIFLAGSLGDMSLTLWFLPILFYFPTFLENLKKEGVGMNAVVRLTKFHELNTIRIFLRILFTLPLLCLGIDGVRPHQHINESMFWTDLLVMIAGFGCVLSSAITLVIFFPRSIEGEITAKDTKRYGGSRLTQSQNSARPRENSSRRTFFMKDYSEMRDPMPDTTPAKGGHSIQWRDKAQVLDMSETIDEEQESVPRSVPSNLTPNRREEYARKLPQTTVPIRPDVRRDVLTASPPPIRPNRRLNGQVELGGIGGMDVVGLSETNLSIHNLHMSSVNHLIHNYTSPINLAYGAPTSPGGQFGYI